MKLYIRSQFIKLPINTVYSRVRPNSGEYWGGLFCKVSDQDYAPDWVEQELICSPSTPNTIINGGDQHYWIEEKLNSFWDLCNDYDCAGRDGSFDEEDLFVVWDKSDIVSLIEYLQKCI